jgi:transcriptional regulator with XRE-family HTH domain
MLQAVASTDHELAHHLEERIAALRAEAGMTQEQLAWAAGFSSKGYLSRIENGLRLPSLQALEQIAEALAVEVRDLLIFPEPSNVDATMEALRQAGEGEVRKVLRKLRER